MNFHVTSWLYIYLELPTHWVKRSRCFTTYTNTVPDILFRSFLKLVEIDLFEESYKKLARLARNSATSLLASKESAHRLGEPSSTTAFKPAEVPTKRGGTQHSERVLLEFSERNCFFHSYLWPISVQLCERFCKAYWVIFCVYCEKRYFDGHQGVTGGCISIICPFGRIAPSRALKVSVICLALEYVIQRELLPVKLIQILYLPDFLDVNTWIL